MTASLRVIWVTALVLCAAPLRQVLCAEPVKEAPARFDVLEYRVLGNTRLPSLDIETVVYPYLGPDKTLEDVESARQALEGKYRAAGFGTVFVDIPEQAVEGGVVRLRVTEGRVDRIRITGARYFSNGRIRDAVPALQSGTVPSLPEIQRQIAALNRETRDRAVVPVLKAGRTPGTVDVELKIQDKLPLHGSLELSDRYTANTSRLRLNASLNYDNLFQRQHSFSLQFQTAPQDTDDVKAAVASYVFRVPDWSDQTFVLYAVSSKSDVAALGTLAVIGDGNIFGFRAIRSLAESAESSRSLTLGIDYKDFKENILLEDDQNLLTPIRYINWSLSYAGSWRDARSSTNFSIGPNFGIRSVINAPADFTDKRFKGKSNYFHLRGNAQRLQQLTNDWQLMLRASAQISADALVSNEQFSVGGADSVRGYFESMQLGDIGGFGTLEARWTGLSRYLKLPAGSAYLQGFFDGGALKTVNPLPAQDSRFLLYSAGAGFRIDGWHGFALSLDWAVPLADLGTVREGQDRVHFSLRYGF